jgi:protein-tyrosine-phosphatase
MSGAPGSVLFACNMNSVRSPMAEALARAILGEGVHVESCGVFQGVADPFVAKVLEEEGLPAPDRAPQSFHDVDLGRFDLVVALTSKAAVEARRMGAKVEFWDTPNPTDHYGTEEDLLAAYRETLSFLRGEIEQRLKG